MSVVWWHSPTPETPKSPRLLHRQLEVNWKIIKRNSTIYMAPWNYFWPSIKFARRVFFSLLWHTHQAVLKYFAYFSFVVFLWPLTTTENQECIRDSWRGSGSEGWSNSSLFVLVWAALASTMSPSSYSFFLVVSAADVPDDHVMPVGLPNMYTQVRSLLALKSRRIFIMCP